MVYAGSTPGVAYFDVQRCDNQLVCSSCVQLKDPYCAWSPSLKKCAVAKSLQDDDRLMDLFKGDASICPKGNFILTIDAECCLDRLGCLNVFLLQKCPLSLTQVPVTHF